MAFGDADASSPAFVASSTGWTTTGGTTASFTPPADSLVRVWVFSDTAGGNVTNTEVVTDSLAGPVGWVFQGSRSKPDSGAQNARVALWTKYYAASPGAITVTAIASATGATDGALSVKVVAGCTGIEALVEGSNTAAAMSIAVTTVSANVRCEMAGTDWNVAANPTAAAGQTALRSQGVGSGPDIRIYIGIMNAVTVTPGTVETLATATPTAANTNNFMAFAYVPSAGPPAGATPDGIAVPVALGAPTAALNLSTAPTGLAVPVALGTPAVTLPGVAPTGIAVPVGLGSHTVTRQSAAPAGIAVAAALGTPTVALNRTAAPSGIAVPVALGNPAVTAGAYPSGIAVPVALGLPTVTRASAAPSGIAVPIALGAPAGALARAAAPAGIAVPVALGTPQAGAAPPVVDYRTAVLTAGATYATLTAGARTDATLTPGSVATATLSASTL